MTVQRPHPDRTFGLLAGLTLALIGVTMWSAYDLVLAGAPAVAAGGAWSGAACLLPRSDDVAPHAASYAFLAAIVAGLVSGMRSVERQQRQTRTLLRACLATRADRHGGARALAKRVGLQGRLDVVDVPGPLAFCYGYLRPRVLISQSLVGALRQHELTALLLHEREHLRQRDPLKVALGRLCTSAVFFVPAFGALYRRYLVEKELAADQAVIVAQGTSQSLAAALSIFLEHGVETRSALAVGSDEALEARIDALVGDPVQLGPRLDRLHLVWSALAVLCVALPPLLSPAAGQAAIAGRAIVAGCHPAP